MREHRELVKPEVIWNVELGWSYTAEQLIEATAARTRLDAAVRSFFGRYDLFLSPGAQVLPFDATLRYPGRSTGSLGNLPGLDALGLVLSATGLPVLAMPAGFTSSGLPVGFQLAANHYRDVQLLSYAKAFEERTGTARIRPAWERSASPASARGTGPPRWACGPTAVRHPGAHAVPPSGRATVRSVFRPAAAASRRACGPAAASSNGSPPPRAPTATSVMNR